MTTLLLHVLMLCCVIPLGLHAESPPPDAKAAKAAPAPAAAATTSAAPERVEIKRFRFQRHGKYQFERLVVEFAGGNPSKSPEIKVTPNSAQKHATVQIREIQLVGAIPEAAINDSYAPQSKYLGNIAISTENGNALVVKTNLKDASLNVDAFLLTSPMRLVIDAFPPSSPRMSGPAVLTSAPPPAPARTSEGVTYQPEAPPAPRPRRSRKAKDELANEPYSCFPVKSQVTTTVTYTDPATGSPQMETDGSQANPPSVSSPDGIACYPKTARVRAVVTFKDVHAQPATTVGETQFEEKPAPVENVPVTPTLESETIRIPSANHRINHPNNVLVPFGEAVYSEQN